MSNEKIEKDIDEILEILFPEFCNGNTEILDLYNLALEMKDKLSQVK